MATHVKDYLRMRRALGFKLQFEGNALPQLVEYLHTAGATTLTADLAIAWARLPQDVSSITWSHRLGAARGFARYLHTIDPSVEIPPSDVFPHAQQRLTPYIYSDDDVARLLEAAHLMEPPQAATYETLFGLLAVTGLRVGEALRLGAADANLDEGVLTIKDAKFDRSRLVPLHPSATAALRCYAATDDRLQPAKTSTFFVSATGTVLTYNRVHETFVALTTATGLRSATPRPRIHDLRHSFAVHTLLNWYRSGADVQTYMPVLSTYLGHVSPASTYWYLSAVPELMQIAAGRLQDHFGGLR